MPAVVYVLMVLAPTTSTGPKWHPFRTEPSQSLCELRAPGLMQTWEGKTPIKWKCVRYSLSAK
jgi:hypothetical protein